MYYVIKMTQEDGGNKEQNRPHQDRLQAIIDFHREIAETLVYPTVKVLQVMLVDDHNNAVQPAFRYERPEEVDPEVTP